MVFIGGIMTRYTITSADNGWIVEWVEEGEMEILFDHQMVFEIPENTDTNKEDPQALIDLLYFIKETVCGQYHSKHKKKNVMIKMEPEEEVA
jgi:hypothetical protein